MASNEFSDAKDDQGCGDGGTAHFKCCRFNVTGMFPLWILNTECVHTSRTRAHTQPAIEDSDARTLTETRDLLSSPSLSAVYRPNSSEFEDGRASCDANDATFPLAGFERVTRVILYRDTFLEYISGVPPIILCFVEFLKNS